MKKYLFLLITITAFATANAQSAKVKNEVKQLLFQQAQDWNNGDIDAFMQSYWKSDQLQFIGNTKVTYGWQNTLDRYKKAYPDKAAMGKLTFEIIEIQKLGSKSLALTGKFMLDRSDLEDLSGHFLLIWRKIKGKWVIVADCTT